MGTVGTSASSDLRSQPDGYESFGAFEETGDQLSGRFQPVTSGVSLPSLQMLYEAIFGCEIDKRNFRKKIHSMNILINTGKKDYSTSKKGAYLYSFDEEKYNSMLENGYNQNFFNI